ncbi:MAG: bifunctional proline dehydrogenase/L-glutamate gamma-semialdehyde dehydrogenase PutA, partial [Gammaproteobacteria bacterium]|nr:bifunctional proline dehydrogenase/L-glutamate gamma-semialdehyde dehydrogenase PutA [Gammaproteobacteria bacterium]
NDGISVKLSALHARYHYSHHAAVMAELLPRLQQLAYSAKALNIGFNIDAEEAERLDISLDLFTALACDPKLAGWDGLGIVVQAYQKRAPALLAWLDALARATERKFMVRLVKGAYWDREIKFAQEMGYQDYPVFTRKENTDLSYRVCAEQLLASGDVLYPQFATHNAMTIAAVLEAADGCPHDYEFQRLHGMGELLYSEVLAEKDLAGLPLRVYAPVGEHKDLLPYLVRRLLENGANSSFVNQFLDKDTPIDDLLEDPVAEAQGNEPKRHPAIPLPRDLYRASGLEPGERDNSNGLDLDDPLAVSDLQATLEKAAKKQWRVGPLVRGYQCTDGDTEVINNPADPSAPVGECVLANQKHIDEALDASRVAQHSWDALGGAQRAKVLRAAADLYEANRDQLVAIINREAGRTLADAISEVREAVDFCRYYALQAEHKFAAPQTLPGPTGEDNQLSLHGRGTFLCISPWNFPLAIFTGQITAALAAGNCVIAKPAEQTPVVAFEAIKLLHQAGVPTDVLHLLTGNGAVLGPKLVPDQRIDGVCFTGSTEVAKLINRQLAERDGPIVPLIAETGGQNAMIVDSSALPEQIVDDALASAFTSAGQRCSALRVLYLQEDIADGVMEMLVGATQMLSVGRPQELATDVGPVIDADAAAGLEAHIAQMRDQPGARIVAQYDVTKVPPHGNYVLPTIIELDSIEVLTREVFGPVLHVIRYHTDDLPNVIQQINDTGYGLTLGVHSRREGFANAVFDATRVGNTYINRNVVGAVVGVQPFGGQGLSGTGPKAGGPHYMLRFATEKTLSNNTVATGGNVSLLNLN